MKLKTLIAVLLLAKASFSQFSYPTKYHAMNMMGRTLVVRLTFSVPEGDSIVRQMIPKYWKLPNKIEFMNETEVQALMKDKTRNKGYAIMSFSNRMETGQTGRTISSGVVHNVAVYLAEMAQQMDRADIDQEDISYSGNRSYTYVKRGAYVFNISFPIFPTTPADYKFLCKQFYDYITYCQSDDYTIYAKYKASKNTGVFTAPLNVEKVKLLKKRKLLIPEEMLITTEDSIRKVYKYPFEIKPYREIQEIINSDTATGYAYFLPLWRPRGANYYLFVVDDSGTDLSEIPMQRTITSQSKAISLLGPRYSSESSFQLNDESLRKLADNILYGENSF
jgi:hypothetical protein